MTIMLLILLVSCGKEGEVTRLEQKNINSATQLLNWNRKNLVSSADLKKEEIAKFFAAEFLIKANERSYTGNYDDYFEFLNKFRESIQSLDYELQEFISNEDKVVIPLRAKIVRTDGNIQIFDAIMILGFNKAGKITLWQEVYAEFVEQTTPDE